MTRAKRDPASILDAIIERAPKLHAAGIKSLSFDGLSVELGTPYMVAATTSNDDWLDRKLEERVKRRAEGGDEQPAYHSDPLSDPSTYNLGGRVPGFARPKKEQS